MVHGFCIAFSCCLTNVLLIADIHTTHDDLIPFIHPDLYLNSNHAFREFYLNKIDKLKELDGLLSISLSSKNEAIRYLGFDEERVFNEIDYIAKKTKNAVTLLIADANFGILERDAKIAARIYSGYEKHGFPSNVAVQWNKTRPDRILNTAKEFKSIAPVGASM